MRKSTEAMYGKVHHLLQSAEGYVTTQKLSDKTGLSKSSIHNIILKMNENGIGVQTRHKLGYVLSEYASQQDDVHIVRRMNSQYARNVMRVQAFMPHMSKRWKSEADKALLNDMAKPMLPASVVLERSKAALQGCIQKLLS